MTNPAKQPVGAAPPEASAAAAPTDGAPAWITDPRRLIGDSLRVDVRVGEGVAFGDHRIAFFTSHAKDKDVLDIGCVNHDPRSHRSPYWVHRALREVARSVVGIDLYEQGVRELQRQGYDIQFADAQRFDLGRTFDVIVAGDMVPHLEDLNGFFRCCLKHLRPDGKLLITTPNPWNWRLLLRSLAGAKSCGNPEQTIWQCPQTLRQLAARHDMSVVDLRYSSGHWIDRFMPLPTGWKHTTIQAVLIKSDAAIGSPSPDAPPLR